MERAVQHSKEHEHSPEVDCYARRQDRSEIEVSVQEHSQEKAWTKMEWSKGHVSFFDSRL
jgi:hypothetical protein